MKRHAQLSVMPYLQMHPVENEAVHLLGVLGGCSTQGKKVRDMDWLYDGFG